MWRTDWIAGRGWGSGVAGGLGDGAVDGPEMEGLEGVCVIVVEALRFWICTGGVPGFDGGGVPATV